MKHHGFRSVWRRVAGSWRWSTVFFAVLCVTNIPTLVQLSLFEGASLAPLPRLVLLTEGALRVMGCVFVLTAAAGFLPRAVRTGLAGLSILLFGVDAFTLRQYHSVLDAGLLEVVAATNPAEAAEYAVSQAGAIAPFAAWTLLAFGLAMLCWKRGNVPASVRCRFIKLRQVRSALAGLVLLFFTAGLVHAWHDPEQQVRHIPQSLSLWRLAVNVQQAKEEIGSTAYVDYTLAQHPVTILSDAHDIPYVIVILGESTSRHHMSLYGYGLPTTPHLDARGAAGELAVFREVTSPHAGTMAVLRTLFSFYDNASEGLWYEYGNLFDILRHSGVRTAWLSNQESSGFYGSIGRTLGGRCDTMKFTSCLSHTIDLSERYDEELLPLLDETLAEESDAESHFLVLHLMGAHEDFQRRYPAAYAQFTAEDERGRGLASGEKERAVRAAYDNAVLYDDAIVDAILRRFEGKDAVVVFLSDHGEEVYDVRDLAGHGDEASPWQRDIPCVVWMSRAFQTNHPAENARIRRATGTHWQSDEMIHTLLDLMKICVPEYDETKSLL